MARAKAKGLRLVVQTGIEIREKIGQRAKKGETPYAIAKRSGLIDTLLPSTHIACLTHRLAQPVLDS